MSYFSFFFQNKESVCYSSIAVFCVGEDIVPYKYARTLLQEKNNIALQL